MNNQKGLTPGVHYLIPIRRWINGLKWAKAWWRLCQHYHKPRVIKISFIPVQCHQSPWVSASNSLILTVLLWNSRHLSIYSTWVSKTASFYTMPIVGELGLFREGNTKNCWWSICLWSNTKHCCFHILVIFSIVNWISVHLQERKHIWTLGKLSSHCTWTAPGFTCKRIKTDKRTIQWTLRWWVFSDCQHLSGPVRLDCCLKIVFVLSCPTCSCLNPNHPCVSHLCPIVHLLFPLPK